MHYISWAFSTLHCTLAVCVKKHRASFFSRGKFRKGWLPTMVKRMRTVWWWFLDGWNDASILKKIMRLWSDFLTSLRMCYYSVYWHPWIHGPFQPPFFPWGIPWILCASMATGTVSNYVSTLWPVTMMTATGYPRAYQDIPSYICATDLTCGSCYFCSTCPRAY